MIFRLFDPRVPGEARADGTGVCPAPLLEIIPQKGTTAKTDADLGRSVASLSSRWIGETLDPVFSRMSLEVGERGGRFVFGVRFASAG